MLLNIVGSVFVASLYLLDVSLREFVHRPIQDLSWLRITHHAASRYGEGVLICEVQSLALEGHGFYLLLQQGLV